MDARWRQLEYVRQTGASVETAKEVKIFNLHRFLIERYRHAGTAQPAANRTLARRRALWGTALAALGSLGYYVAYAYIAWRTVKGDRRPDLPGRQLLAPAPAAGRPLRASLQVAGQALYLLSCSRSLPSSRRSLRRPIRRRSRSRSGRAVRNVGFRYPDAQTWRAPPGLQPEVGEVRRAGRRERQDHAGHAAGAARPTRTRPHPADRGRDLRDYDLTNCAPTRRCDLLVDFVRYYLTAGENIGVGRIEVMDDAAHPQRRAQRAGRPGDRRISPPV